MILSSNVRWFDLSLLFVLILLSTSLSYMWLGGLPYWLWAVMFALFLIIMPSRARATREIFVSSRWKIILPWVMYVLVIVVIDASTGALVSSFTDRVVLNIAALLLFVVSAVLGLRCHWWHVLYIVGFIGFLFGIVAIAQFAGIETIWELPNVLSSISSVNVNDVLSEKISDFEAVGRARGLDIFVHKFAAYQGMIAGMVVTLILTSWQLLKRDRKASWSSTVQIILFALISTIGVLLTFSRSPILGIVLVILATVWYSRGKAKFFPIVIFVIMAILLVVFAMAFDITQTNQFGRLINSSDSYQSDSLRIASIIYSIELFLNNPLFGGGSGSMSGLDISTHSVPLRILGDFGLIGFFFYALVWWALLKNAYLAIRQPDVESKLIGKVVMAALVVAIVDNLTHSSGLLQRDSAQPALLGLCYGLTVGALRRNHA